MALLIFLINFIINLKTKELLIDIFGKTNHTSFLMTQMYSLSILFKNNCTRTILIQDPGV